jgi:hypothetical protein
MSGARERVDTVVVNPYYGSVRLRGGVSGGGDPCRPCEERSLHGTMPSLSRIVRRASLTRQRRASSLAGPRKEGSEAVSEAGVNNVGEGDGVAGGEVGSEVGDERPGCCRRTCSLLMAMPFWYVSLVGRNAECGVSPSPLPLLLLVST